MFEARAQLPRLAFQGILIILLLAVSACASSQIAKPVSTPTSALMKAPAAQKTPAPGSDVKALQGLNEKQRVKRAISLLSIGDAAHAKTELEAATKQDPGDDLPKDLLSQITEDPKTLLGEQNFSYVIAPGETLSELADRFLKSRLMFYALARYNGISDPSQAQVGETILIPGVRKRTAPIKQTHLDEDVAKPKVEAAKPPAPPSGPARDPTKASELRGRALEEMSKGVISSAVVLLREALNLDPGNPLIQADLDRATRILNQVAR